MAIATTETDTTEIGTTETGTTGTGTAIGTMETAIAVTMMVTDITIATSTTTDRETKLHRC